MPAIPQRLPPEMQPYGAVAVAAGAGVLLAVLLIQGRLFLPGLVIERDAQPRLYWATAALFALVGLAGLILLAGFS